MDSIKTSKSVKSYAPQKGINIEGFAHKTPALVSRLIGKSPQFYIFLGRVCLYIKIMITKLRIVNLTVKLVIFVQIEYI